MQYGYNILVVDGVDILFFYMKFVTTYLKVKYCSAVMEPDG